LDLNTEKKNSPVNPDFFKATISGPFFSGLASKKMSRQPPGKPRIRPKRKINEKERLYQEL
jgi:hypothetical protein